MIYPVKKDCKMLLAGWRREVGSGSRGFFETPAGRCWLKSKTSFCNAAQAASLAGVFAGREALHIYLPASRCILPQAKFGILDI